MKIVYIIDSICNLGGIEKITIAKANALSQIENNIIYIIVAENKGIPYMQLNSKVQLINLDIKYNEDYGKSKFAVYKTLLKKRKLHKTLLKKELNIIHPDIVISVGKSEKFFLTSLKINSNPVFIREFHCNKNHRFISSKSIKDKLIAYIGNIYEYKFIINRYDAIILLTEEEKKLWSGKKIITIPNPITEESPKYSNLSNKIVTAAGRLSFEKNFHSLIHVWKIVQRKHPNWILEIWGDGELKSSIQETINIHNLQHNIYLKGHTHNIIEQLQESSIHVLSSITEGLPLIIIEAMSCGLPIVSYDCSSGIRDLISDGIDGFLIPTNNEKIMAEKIIYLIENEIRRKEMGIAAKRKSEKYQIGTIINKWMDTFNDLLKKKQYNL